MLALLELADILEVLLIISVWLLNHNSFLLETAADCSNCECRSKYEFYLVHFHFLLTRFLVPPKFCTGIVRTAKFSNA